MKKNTVLFWLIIAVNLSLHAELLIFKKTAEGLQPLTKEESLRHGPVISEIILKYQWPMCTAHNLTKAEKDELLTPGIPNAEEIFIQKKLKEAIPDLDIQVAFIPTTLYELFCIAQFVQSSKYDLTENSIDFSKSSFERAAMTLASERIGTCAVRVRNLTKFENWLSVFLIPNITNSSVFEIFSTYNQLFFDTQMTVKFRTFEDKSKFSAPSSLFIKDDISAFIYINNALVSYLLLNMKKGLQISEKSWPELLDKFIVDFSVDLKTNSVIYALRDNMYDFYEIKVADLYQEKSLEIIKEIIALEYKARNKNYTFLLRGTRYQDISTSPLEKLNKHKIAGTTIHYSKSLEEVFTLYDTNKLRAYSLSFGQSLFAGLMLDPQASAYYYLSSNFINEGYAILIDKRKYMDSQNDSLFFIPPVATITALFGFGLFFHPRSKIAINAIQAQQMLNNELISVKGIPYYTLPFDHTGLFMVIRNPLKQAELFSQYLTTNGIILQFGILKQEEAEIMQSQKKATKLYKDVRLIKSKLSNWIDQYRGFKK